MNQLTRPLTIECPRWSSWNGMKRLKHEVVMSMSKPGAGIACSRLSNDAFNYNS